MHPVSPIVKAGPPARAKSEGRSRDILGATRNWHSERRREANGTRREIGGEYAQCIQHGPSLIRDHLPEPKARTVDGGFDADKTRNEENGTYSVGGALKLRDCTPGV